jgi:hypothetical protein
VGNGKVAMTVEQNYRQAKKWHPVVYGCLRVVALYVFVSITSLAYCKALHVWPGNDTLWFFIWPYTLILGVVNASFDFPGLGVAVLAIFAGLQLPIVFGLWCGKRWYWNLVILFALYIQFFIMTFLRALS